MRKELVTYYSCNQMIRSPVEAEGYVSHWLRTVLSYRSWDHYTLKHLLGLTTQEALQLIEGQRPLSVAEMMVISMIAGYGINDIVDAINFNLGPAASAIRVEAFVHEAFATFKQQDVDPTSSQIAEFVRERILNSGQADLPEPLYGLSSLDRAV